MTDPDYTHISLLVDRSGSMSAIRTDAEGGLRAFLKEQSELPGKLTVSLYDFDTEYRCVASAVTASAPSIATWRLRPRGATALLDALARAVIETGSALAEMLEYQRPGKVIFVVVTDGEENASREYARERVFEMISHQRDVYDWQFVFLAANQDAIANGTSMGFSAASAANYTPTSAGVRSVYAMASASVAEYRSGAYRSVTLTALDDDELTC